MASLSQRLRAAVRPLPEIADPSFPTFIDSYASSRVILIGEASHGTSEFYRARAAITKRLIERHGLTVTAVEADWPDAAAIDRYVRNKTGPSPVAAERPFSRFPTWMWRNRDVSEFVTWLRERNLGAPSDKQVGFYGLDLYNLNASIRAVIDYLNHVDPEAAAVAKRRYGCLARWSTDPARYGAAALSKGYAPCEKGVVKMLKELFSHKLEYTQKESDGEASQNARLVASAEAYYRAIY